MQPGETITPGGSPAPAQEPEKTEVPLQAPVEQTPQTAPEHNPAPSPVVPSEPEANWQFTSNENPTSTGLAPAQINPVSWSASEYIAHNKGVSWFVLLGVALFVLVVGAYFVAGDIITPVVVAIAGITFGVFAGRPPRVLQYSLDSRGIKIGDKFYAYSDFRSFDISDDSPLPAILLLPLKRFLPPITVFYEQKEEDAILNVLGSYLPHEEQQPDMVDRLMRRIRF